MFCLDRPAAVKFLTKVKEDRDKKVTKSEPVTSKAPKTSTISTPAAPRVPDRFTNDRIIMQKSGNGSSLMLWSLVAIGLGIVTAIVIMNYAYFLRWRMHDSDHSDGDDNRSGTSYSNFGSNRKSRLQQFWGNLRARW